MNTFKRKALMTAALVVLGFALAGCGLFGKKDEAPVGDGLVVSSSPSTPSSPLAAVLQECARQIGTIATSTSGGEASKVASVGALERLCGGHVQGLQLGQQTQQQPQSILGVLWTGLLQAADIAMRGYGLKMQRDVSIVQSNNQASTAIASYGAFTQLGGSIERAGVAGYPYVQAPGAVTTNTLSGTGVLGSGTYTGPVSTTTTTTRTCSSGAAGAGGGTTTGAAGGASGGANC